MLGSVIGAVGSLVGGRKARKAQRRADEENWRRQQEMNRLNAEAVEKQNAFNVAQVEKQNKFNSQEAIQAFRRSMQAANVAFQRNKLAISEQNAYNSPAAIRARAESSGFNPLSFVGAGVGQQAGAAQMLAPSAQAAQGGAAQGGAASYAASMVSADNFGSAISNAGLLLADGVNAAAQEKAVSTQLAQQNAELRKALNSATLRPEVPGVFGTVQPVTVPKLGPSNDAMIDGGQFAQIKPALQAASLAGDVPVEHKWIKIYDQKTGTFTWYPNPDLMDAGPSEMATGMATIGAAETAQHGYPGGFGDMFPPPSSRGPMSLSQRKGIKFKKPGSDNARIPRIRVGQ